MEIENLLTEVGIKNNRKGFYYLVSALKLLLHRGDLSYTMKDLYQELHESYCLATRNIENEMRNAIANSNRGYQKLGFYARPTTREFLHKAFFVLKSRGL